MLSLSQSLMLAGGALGAGVAVVHGVVMTRLIIRPLDASLAQTHALRLASRRLVSPLLHYSTFAWLTGGLALIATAFLDEDTRRAIGILVGATYLYAALANGLATRGRHPGGWLMASAVGLIGAALLVGAG